MDEIQKVLVETGRKDLAQKYYLKTTAAKSIDSLSNLKSAITEFVKAIKSPIVYLKLDKKPEFRIFKGDKKYYSFKFEICFQLKDKYVNPKKYDAGEAIIYPSQKLYDDIDKTVKRIFPKAELTWNNTRTYGSVSVWEE